MDMNQHMKDLDYQKITERRRQERWDRIRANTEELIKRRPYYPFINTELVYFLKDKNSNNVKIGWTWAAHIRVVSLSRSLFNRDSFIIGLFRGDRSLEDKCHKTFRDQRIQRTGEMFYYNDDMKKYLDSVMTEEEKNLVKILNEKILGVDIESEVKRE